MPKPNMSFDQVAPLIIQQYERYIPSAFDDQMSMLQKVNQVIMDLQRFGKITNGLIDSWNEVMEWIINDGISKVVADRLDQMAEDGTLAEIINEHLFKQLKDDMEALKKSSLQTGAFYKGVTFDRFYDNDTETTINVVRVPHKDENGKIIPLKQGFGNDGYDKRAPETPRSFAKRNGTTVLMNGSTFTNTYNRPVGLIINSGKVLQNEERQPFNWTLGITPENDMKAFDHTVSPSTILQAGYTTALSGFIPILIGGRLVPDDIYNSREMFGEYAARSWIAQDNAKNLYFFSCDARRFRQRGLTMKESAEVTRRYDPYITFAFQMDGGGSTQTVLYDSLVNKITDGYKLVEREVFNFLYVGKDIKESNNVNEVFNPLSDIIQNVRNNVQELENGLSYEPKNRILLTDYLINGYKATGTTGSTRPWCYVLGNNSLYLMGAFGGGESGKPFMRLPRGIRPVFTTHHLVPGNARGEIFKIVIDTNGYLQAYYWNNDPIDLDYIRLDGIIIPILAIDWTGLFTNDNLEE